MLMFQMSFGKIDTVDIFSHCMHSVQFLSFVNYANELAINMLSWVISLEN